MVGVATCVALHLYPWIPLFAVESSDRSDEDLVSLVRGWCARLGGWIGAEASETITPMIDYDFEFQLTAHGGRTLSGRHNRFPSYRVIVQGPADSEPREVYRHNHAGGWWNFLSPLGLDVRPLVLLPDVERWPLDNWMEVNRNL